MSTSQNALVGFLTDGMITHPGYPASIQVPHALAAAVSFRSSFTEEEWRNVSPWHKLIGGYFCNGYGGSSCRDFALGVAPSLISSPTVYKFWLTCSFLVNYSPGDVVYKMLTQKHHPLRLAMLFGEAVDSATTVCGAFEKGARLHPDAPFAPYATAGIAALGGTIVRYFERAGRGKKVTSEWAHPTGGIQRSTVYILAYSFLRQRFGVRTARLSVTLFHVAVTMYVEFTGHKIDPAAALCQYMLAYIGAAKVVFKLGPKKQ